MASSLTIGLVITATVLGGFLAGGNVDRALVHMPAWRRVGARAWAEFSRHADLGNGRIWYPLEAIGGALVTIAAAVAFHFDPTAPRSAAVPLYAATALVLGGLLATTQAAPRMLSLRRIGEDEGALQAAFDGFERWGGVRGTLQVLAFGAQVWSLVTVVGRVG
jgi:hypothetical protein